MNENPEVVIIGAGFAGLWAVRELSRANVKVALIDRNNYHTFLPLLYQVAAAELRPEDISYPVRGLVRRMKNVRFLMDCVNSIDPASRMVHTTRQSVPYDYLIMSFGSTTDYYGIPGAADFAFPLKTLEDGAAIRNHFLSRLERAAHEKDRARRECLLSFVIVGGGPTGVEYAGALAELVYGPVARDYPELDIKEVSITVLEGASRLLGAMPEAVGEYARKRLESMGVLVRLGATVTKIDENKVYLADGAGIPSQTVVWTAGIRGVPEAARSGLQLARGGRISVRPTLQTEEHDEIYVAGDLALFQEDGRPLPMVAPVAVQQGHAAAGNIIRQIKGEALQPFVYADRGAMVTIGRNSAAAFIGGKVFTGFTAWLLWLGVHIFNLIGIPNRVFVMFDWAMDYFFMERTVRLILPGEKNCLWPDDQGPASCRQ
jgi:NADH:ubiquinone reductase (H+-translocating)